MENQVIENKPGYKKTKLGWIPEDWSVLKLEDCSDYRKGFAFKSNEYLDRGIRIIRVSDTDSNSIKNIKGVYIDPSAEKKYSKWQLKNGDLIFSTVGSRPPMYDSMVGKAINVGLEHEGMLLNQNAVRIRGNSNVIQNLLIYFFKQKRYLNYIETIARGNANQVSITLNDLFKFKLPIPPLPEQKAIANCLTTWDTAITNLNTIIKAKQKLKKALMQQLLSGKKRLPGFDGEWLSKRFDYFLDYSPRPVEKPNTAFTKLGIRSHCKGTFQNENFKPADIAIDTMYLVKPNDLIVNITFAWEGAIAIVKDNDVGALVSHRFPTYTFKDGLSEVKYFRQFIQTKKFRFLLELISPGGAGRNRVLSKKELDKLKIRIPSVEEQTAIAQVLNTADQEINLLTTQKDHLQLQKKGLMQQLLTGKTRLKV